MTQDKLAEALQTCISVMDEAGRKAAMKELTNEELGKMWLSVVDKAKQILTAYEADKLKIETAKKMTPMLDDYCVKNNLYKDEAQPSAQAGDVQEAIEIIKKWNSQYCLVEELRTSIETLITAAQETESLKAQIKELEDNKPAVPEDRQKALDALENLHSDAQLYQDCDEGGSKEIYEEYETIRQCLQRPAPEIETDYAFTWKWIERALFDRGASVESFLDVLKYSPEAPWNREDINWDTSHKSYHKDIQAIADKPTIDGVIVEGE